jgi:hypothetical protein
MCSAFVRGPLRASWEDGSGRVLCARTRAVGELKKSRRNRGALHGDFHGGEADVFANYALALHFDCDSFLLAFPAGDGP